jgi:hypothetical protein
MMKFGTITTADLDEIRNLQPDGWPDIVGLKETLDSNLQDIKANYHTSVEKLIVKHK